MAKNIVLLSDGTGNSSAQLMKTNVWRVYEALELSKPSEQVACYDDGVGTSSFKPLALLGGGLGIGLKKNVLRMYRFLCEHYDPGDRIYAFGFSRGAFTIRVLIGLVCSQGIVKTRPSSPMAKAYPEGSLTDAADAAADAGYAFGDLAVRTEPQVFGKELARLTRWAYRGFRREFNQTGRMVTAARFLRDVVLRWWEGDVPRYNANDNHQVDGIAFLGLWDTVDAYGLPVDELTDGINQWVWPLFAPDQRLSKKVTKACHVLAIDDERNTFHPVLWDESNERQDAAHLDKERISQVWFAGMHANVGGGYPDDALSYVSLRWITTEATKQGLRFVPTLLHHHTDKADPFGRIYDSRSGLKGYYRYNPRRIKWLTDGQAHEAGFGDRPRPSKTAVRIARPKIHESVLARIAAAPEAYAPIIFPDHYAVVREDGRIIDGADNPYESDAARKGRVVAQERAWNLVWWRRVLYYAAVAVSLVLVALPFTASVPSPLTPADTTVASRLVSTIGGTLPSLAQPWVTFYSARLDYLFGLLFVILLLRSIGSKVQTGICGRMRSIWSQVIPPPGRELDRLAPPTDLLYRIRMHPYYLGTFAVINRHVLPTVFGLGMLLLLALLAAGVTNRVLFETANGLGAFCQSAATSTAVPLPVGATRDVALRSDVFCNPTGIQLEEGARYRVRLGLPGQGGWRDGSIGVSSPAGFNGLSAGLTPWERVLVTVNAPFRRMWSVGWFAPVGRIGKRGFDQYPLARLENEFTARKSGELFLFVNDAIALGRDGWQSYYTNNNGTATVAIRKLGS